MRLGLPHFSQFETGEMEFQPEGQGFKFEGEATSSTLQFLREDMAELESGYAVAIQAEPVTVALDEASSQLAARFTNLEVVARIKTGQAQ